MDEWHEWRFIIHRRPDRARGKDIMSKHKVEVETLKFEHSMWLAWVEIYYSQMARQSKGLSCYEQARLSMILKCINMDMAIHLIR